jgi:hypothetical protein
MRLKQAIVICGALVPGIVVLSTPVGARAGGVIASSNFNDDTLDGWTSNTPSEVKAAKTGGNTGGYARFVDGGGVPIYTYISAPSTFFGDYAALSKGGGGVIQFDHKIFDSGNGDTYNPYSIFLSGPGGSATWTGLAPVVTNFTTPWVTVIAPLVQSDGWKVDTGSWAALLQNVTQLEITIELVDNDHKGASSADVEGIDNIMLRTVPEPAGLALAGIALLAPGVTAWKRWRMGRRAVA